MAEINGKSWGRVFAETMQGLLDHMQRGVGNRLSLFMEREKVRVLGDKPAFTVPSIGQLSAVADEAG